MHHRSWETRREIKQGILGWKGKFRRNHLVIWGLWAEVPNLSVILHSCFGILLLYLLDPFALLPCCSAHYNNRAMVLVSHQHPRVKHCKYHIIYSFLRSSADFSLAVWQVLAACLPARPRVWATVERKWVKKALCEEIIIIYSIQELISSKYIMLTKCVCECESERWGDVIRKVSSVVGVSKTVVLSHTVRSHINLVEPVTVHAPETPHTHTPLQQALSLSGSDCMPVIWQCESMQLHLTCCGLSLCSSPLDCKQTLPVSGQPGLCPCFVLFFLFMLTRWTDHSPVSSKQHGLMFLNSCCMS